MSRFPLTPTRPSVSLQGQQKTPRSPQTKSGGDKPVLPARPQGDFFSWWTWGTAQADASRDESPMRLHDEDRPVEGHAQRQQLIMGWPFSYKFERWCDDNHTGGPMTRVMGALFNPRGAQCHEFRILFALVNGHHDVETVRAVLGGCRRQFFEAAAIRAFELVYERARQEIVR